MNAKQAFQLGTPGAATAWLVWQIVTVWFPIIPSYEDWQETSTTLGALTIVFAAIYRGVGITMEKKRDRKVSESKPPV